MSMERSNVGLDGEDCCMLAAMARCFAVEVLQLVARAKVSMVIAVGHNSLDREVEGRVAVEAVEAAESFVHQ